VAWSYRVADHDPGGEVVGLKPTADNVTEVYFGPILLGTLHADRRPVGLVRVAD
jgi:hypothetical protein